MLYLGVIVLLPLAALILRPVELGWAGFWRRCSTPRVLAALRLSFGAALIAAIVNAFFGLIIAWVLVRYRFPGRRIVDALVDLPFALPTAVAGIALTAIYAPNGWIGALLAPLGIKIAFTPLGVVDRADLHRPALRRAHGAAGPAGSGAGSGRGGRHPRRLALPDLRAVILPVILPALLTGFALAFARAVGEYGSIIFIAGNMPMVSEIAPLLIVIKLEQFDYAGRGRDRRRHARRLLRHAAGDQSAAALVPPAGGRSHERLT